MRQFSEEASRSEDKSSEAVLSSEVRVEVGATDHTSGSSEITTRNVTNFPWDQNYLTGSLVAVHCSGAYLAYAIKGRMKNIIFAILPDFNNFFE